MGHRQPAERLGALIPAILKHVEREHSALALVQQSWRDVVGRQLAAHVKPISLRRGRLVVAVSDPGDHYMLRFERPQILERLRRLTGGKVEELVARPGTPSRGRARTPRAS